MKDCYRSEEWYSPLPTPQRRKFYVLTLNGEIVAGGFNSDKALRDWARRRGIRVE